MNLHKTLVLSQLLNRSNLEVVCNQRLHADYERLALVSYKASNNKQRAKSIIHHLLPSKPRGLHPWPLTEPGINVSVYHGSHKSGSLSHFLYGFSIAQCVNSSG